MWSNANQNEAGERGSQVCRLMKERALIAFMEDGRDSCTCSAERPPSHHITLKCTCRAWALQALPQCGVCVATERGVGKRDPRLYGMWSGDFDAISILALRNATALAFQPLAQYSPQILPSVVVDGSESVHEQLHIPDAGARVVHGPQGPVPPVKVAPGSCISQPQRSPRRSRRGRACSRSSRPHAQWQRYEDKVIRHEGDPPARGASCRTRSVVVPARSFALRCCEPRLFLPTSGGCICTPGCRGL